MHIIRELTLPDRYERLSSQLGTDVANLLVMPAKSSVDDLRLIANEVLTRDEGILIPVFGKTGAGKTTFAMNVSHWLPKSYAPAHQYDGALTFEGLVASVTSYAKMLPANNRLLVPINIDHRENSPPTDAELAAIKRFLRTNAANIPSVIFWPETKKETADDLATRYIEIAGSTSINLPLNYEGPPRTTWRDIARHTLSLTNKIDHLDELGVDPDDYTPDEYRTLGDFLRKLAQDFNHRVEVMRQEFEKPVSVTIVFASESSAPGVLAQLTSPSRYGLLDAHALVSVTSQSEIGRWWAARRGLLTRTIVQLNASALCLPPIAAVSCIRNFADSIELFDQLGYRRYGEARGVRDLKRSDIGKMLTNVELSRFEARGTPAVDATAAFQLLGRKLINGIPMRGEI